jgi:hypothetical protein
MFHVNKRDASCRCVDQKWLAFPLFAVGEPPRETSSIEFGSDARLHLAVHDVQYLENSTRYPQPTIDRMDGSPEFVQAE